MSAHDIVFPFTPLEVYTLFYGFVLMRLLYAIAKAIGKRAERKLEDGRRYIIKQHVFGEHKAPLKQCHEDDCTYL